MSRSNLPSLLYPLPSCDTRTASHEKHGTNRPSYALGHISRLKSAPIVLFDRDPHDHVGTSFFHENVSARGFVDEGLYETTKDVARLWPRCCCANVTPRGPISCVRGAKLACSPRRGPCTEIAPDKGTRPDAHASVYGDSNHVASRGRRLPRRSLNEEHHRAGAAVSQFKFLLFCKATP